MSRKEKTMNRVVQAGGTLLILIGLGIWSASESEASQIIDDAEEHDDATDDHSDADGGTEERLGEDEQPGDAEANNERSGNMEVVFSGLKVPVPDGVRLVEIEVELVWETDALTPSEVLAIYEGRLPAAGYRIEEVEDNEIKFSDDEVEGEIEVEEHDGVTRFEIEVKRKIT
jgi:hypothetical protein